MDTSFFISLFVVALISALFGFIPEHRIKRSVKIFFIIIIVGCLLYQGWYGYEKKKDADDKDFEDDLYKEGTNRSLKGIEEITNELKDKEKKGTLTDADYNLYIAHYLENIDVTLREFNRKSTREWITAYYEEVNKIPGYFTFQEWKEVEKLLYSSILTEISNKRFSNKEKRQKALEMFEVQRNRLLQAKERAFEKSE